MCTKSYRLSWYKKNKQKVAAQVLAYRKANPEKIKAYLSAYHKTEKRKAQNRAWATANRSKVKAIHKTWRKANPAKINSEAAKHRAYKLQRTPTWLTEEHLKEIEQFYIEARELSWLSDGGLHVDHIVPLKGKNVSGLHVPWNLQIIPMSMNCSKGNRFNS